MSKAVVIAGLVAVLAVGVACQAQADARRGDGPVLGLQAVTEPLPWFDSERNHAAFDPSIRDLRPNFTVAATSLGRSPMDSPVSVRLSRYLYPAEDGHLDVLVRFDMDLGQTPQGRLLVSLHAGGGNAVSQGVVSPIPGSQLHFSYRIPAEMAGGAGELRVVWERPEGAAQSAAKFEVAPAAAVETAGRVRLTVPNKSGAVVPSAPMTVGVPFPRGALASADNLRLVDGQGNEIPLQVKETARWSRFGGVKWALCDFTLDLDGGPRDVYLEYGPEVSRTPRADLAVALGGAFPTVEAGRLRLSDGGVAFDPAGDGSFRTVLEGEALAGAFVEHSRGVNFADWGHRHMTSAGKTFTMGAPTFEVEESGPEKVVLRTEGWYAEPETGEQFCKFVVRYVVHRGSPVVRIFHTWIYTGDGNRDTIRNMGWRFPLQDGVEAAGFLASFEEDGAWAEGYYLRQHSGDEYALFEHDEPRRGRRAVGDVIPSRPLQQIATGRRAPGVMAAQGQGVRVFVGVQDFWRNFPSSLRQEEGEMAFYQWPRYGRARQNPVHAGDAGNVWRLWFAHEGETLNFRLPAELTEAPLYIMESGPEPHFAFGQADSVNAQGVAKTAEMWLYLAPEDVPPAQAARVMKGLHEETLRAVVDPQWMAASGAFYEIAASDRENLPELERPYDDNVRSPLLQVERMGVHGKWIYGDVLRSADLDEQTAGLYRTFRKAHWGWPYSWTPFARTGDVELMRFAQAATRMMSDTAFCHYVGEDLERYFAEELAPRQMWALLQPFRRKGWQNRNLIPWAGYWGPTTRCYVDQADYLWDAWFISGYHRAKDVALDWAEQTKIEEADKIMRGPITAAQNRARWPANLQKQYIEMYEATWDPWFLAGAQAIADMHVWRFREEDYPGHFWHAGYQTWQRYSGCPEHKEFVLRNARHWADWHQQGWATSPTTTIPATVFGYYLTGDEYYLRRLAGVADLAKWAIFNGEEPDYYRGWYVRGRSSEQMLWTSWMQKWYPMVLGAFDRAGGVPDTFHPFAFDQAVGAETRVAVRKQAGQPLALRVGANWTIQGPDGRTYKEGEGRDAVIEADAPAGTYTVSFAVRGRRPRWVRMPISPPGTPEVLLPGEGATVGMGQDFAQHWFMVPEGAESFWIEFENPAFFRQAIRQVVIWTPDGQEAWAHRERAVDHDPQVPTIRAEVQVAPGQAGRLWRVTLPGQRSMPFRLSPNVPGVLAHEPGRWFEPGG